MEWQLKWKEDWPAAQEHLIQWWAGNGLALHLSAPRPEPVEPLEAPDESADLLTSWLDPAYRRAQSEYQMAQTWYGADAFPNFNTTIGPGSLGLFLGAGPIYEPSTVWYEPCIHDPASYGAIRFSPENNQCWDEHLALIEEGLAHSHGRYLVGMPDLIENIDTLAAMRGNEEVLLDLIERPEWVERAIREINQAFFTAFDLIYDRVKDERGGSVFCAFDLWGPGKTAKVQCDLCLMISPAMFNRFVLPSLTEQCDWLDYSMYHLDGTGCIIHLDALLGIDSLNAIEWTPESGLPGGGDPCWYDLYRRIKAAGKGVQAIGVSAEQIIPLLDAVGPEGMYIMSRAESIAQAEEIISKVEAYR